MENEAQASQTPKEESSQSSIFGAEGILMLAAGGLFDALGLIPVVGWIADVIAVAILLFWIFITGRTSKILGKILLRGAIALVLESIPVVSDITPFISLAGIAFNKGIPASWSGWVFWVLKNT